MTPICRRCVSLFRRCSQLLMQAASVTRQITSSSHHARTTTVAEGCNLMCTPTCTPRLPLQYTCSNNLMRCKTSAAGQRELHTDTTLDEEEVAKFRGLYESWWDANGEFLALHSMNDLRVPLVRDGLVRQQTSHSVAVCQPLSDKVILDVGCGGGILSEPLARLGATVIGVDAAAENINVAQEHASHDPLLQRRLKYICATAEDLLGSEEEAFDAVIASEVLEHVNNVESLVATCAKLTKPGGSLFFTTINKTWFSYALAVVGAEDIAKVVPQGTHDWNKFIPPEDLQSFLQANDCQTRLVHGMIFNPLTKRWFWGAPRACNYAIHAIKNEDTTVDTSEQH